MDDRNDGLWGHDAYCDAVEAEIARFVAVIEEAGPATPVPTCPGWTIAKLAKHVGITHRSVEYMVRNKLRERVSPRDVPADLPADESGQVAWLKDGGARLVATLRAADPGIPNGRPVDEWGMKTISAPASAWNRFSAGR